MATHSGILVWSIPWTEEPGGLQSTARSRTRLSHEHYFVHLGYSRISSKVPCAKMKSKGDRKCRGNRQAVRDERAAFQHGRERVREQVWGVHSPGRQGRLTVSVPVRRSGNSSLKAGSQRAQRWHLREDCRFGCSLSILPQSLINTHHCAIFP